MPNMLTTSGEMYVGSCHEEAEETLRQVKP